MNTNTILLFGGPSGERLVSVASAQNILAAAGVSGLIFEPWFIAPDLMVHYVQADQVLAHQRPFEFAFQPWKTVETCPTNLHAALEQAPAESLFFIALHGTWGEDGKLQRTLRDYGHCFTGSGPQACADAFDKTRTKEILSQADIPVPKTLNLLDGAPLAPQLRELFETHGPLVCKPIRGGSSIGLLLIRSRHDIEAAEVELGNITADISSETGVLVESLVIGRELTVGVVESPEGPEALPISEVVTSAEGRFDYQGKYLGRGSTEITPANLNSSDAEQISRLAERAHTVLCCGGYSRTDIFLSPDGPVVLELNTHPGLSKASFIPQQLAAAGRQFSDFLCGQIELARTPVVTGRE